MQRTAAIVIGLGYGDEGKGLTTDFLCSVAKQPLVVRFNGGHQAGHTVVSKDGTKHVFSSFGAGTLRNVPTYWSKNCTFSPAYLLYELATLPVQPKLYVDINCPVTTHYDVLYNRRLEEKRRLGSCGAGFGATIDRHFVDSVKFFAGELLTLPVYRKRLKEIRGYYKTKFEREIALPFDGFKHDEQDEKFCQDIDELQALIAKGVIAITNEKEIFSSTEWCEYVFEGAQGILLDQEFGFKPYITKSNTTTQNALALLRTNTCLKAQDISVFYVTRSYLTRHGGGPFNQFSDVYRLRNHESESNVINKFQGEFKKGFLDLELLNYALKCDKVFSDGLSKNLVITCLDQLNDNRIFYHSNGEIKFHGYERFYTKLNCNFTDVLFSFSPSSETMCLQRKV